MIFERGTEYFDGILTLLGHRYTHTLYNNYFSMPRVFLTFFIFLTRFFVGKRFAERLSKAKTVAALQKLFENQSFHISAAYSFTALSEEKKEADAVLSSDF